MGRLFAYGALARSGRLTKEWNADKNTPYIKEFTSILISLAAKKRYLQEPAVTLLIQLVEKVLFYDRSCECCPQNVAVPYLILRMWESIIAR